MSRDHDGWRCERGAVWLLAAFTAFPVAASKSAEPMPLRAGVIGAMQVYEEREAARLWVFATESRYAGASGAVAPAYGHVVLLDAMGIASTQRFRTEFTFDARSSVTFYKDGEKSIFAVESHTPNLVHIRKLTATGFERATNDEIKRLMKMAKDAATDLPEALLQDGTWSRNGVHLAFQHLGKNGGFVRISKSSSGMLTVDEVKSTLTGYTLSPDLSHLTLTAERDGSGRKFVIVDTGHLE